MTDRPRRSDEDVIAWAIETGRFSEQRAAHYRRSLDAGKITASAIEMLVPIDDDGPAPIRASSPGGARRPVRAATAPAGDPAGEFLANDAMYREASTVAPPPELFPGGGALPLATASGLDPRAMSGVPWWLRPAIAEAPTLSEATQLLQDASTPEGVAASGLETRYTNSPGLKDFKVRVQSWAMQGGAAAGAREWEAQYEQAKNVAAAAARPMEERSDAELYDVIFGSADQHQARIADTERQYKRARGERS